MSSGPGTQPTATTYDVEQLAKWAWEGRIRIPHFQRPLRWQRDDVIRLFDSILRGYPVGSLLLWHRPAKAERVHLGALLIEAPQLADALWVVDGQQWITGLANALHPGAQLDDRFRISYDLRKKMFVPTPRDSSRGDVIPLPVIFDLREVLRWSARASAGWKTSLNRFSGSGANGTSKTRRRLTRWFSRTRTRTRAKRRS